MCSKLLRPRWTRNLVLRSFKGRLPRTMVTPSPYTSGRIGAKAMIALLSSEYNALQKILPTKLGGLTSVGRAMLGKSCSHGSIRIMKKSPNKAPYNHTHSTPAYTTPIYTSQPHSRTLTTLFRHASIHFPPRHLCDLRIRVRRLTESKAGLSPGLLLVRRLSRVHGTMRGNKLW